MHKKPAVLTAGSMRASYKISIGNLGDSTIEDFE